MLETPSQSGIIPRIAPTRGQLERDLAPVRAGLGPVRRAAVARHPLDRRAGPRRPAGTVAAINVTVHAAETSVAELKRRHLPLLLATAAEDHPRSGPTWRASRCPTAHPRVGAPADRGGATHAAIPRRAARR